jgi:hypothetical protein
MSELALAKTAGADVGEQRGKASLGLHFQGMSTMATPISSLV